ncbi:MAG: DUF4430 domain-containing protein [Lachnospiraceae bacterium]|nr:DUF4430 domain-containing protein [Lachnospiraceae bacterium]
MTKVQKLRIMAIFGAIIIIAAGVAVFLNLRETEEGIKNFQVEIISVHNNYHETKNEKSDLLYLGEYLRIMEACQGDDSAFGFFVTGWDGVENDESLFWWVSVNGEDALVGVDEIPLIDGHVYTFTHTAGGW